MSDDQASTNHASDVSTVEAPPTTILGILRRLGPGLIVAGSIVGSGELIATTATGAQAGFWLLWLIIIGCVIKVFVQVELGRHAITHGKTTMTGMNEVPGPTLELTLTGRPDGFHFRGNWLIVYWVLMFLCSLAQLGGIVGGVGQALAISVPLSEAGREYNEVVDVKTKQIVELHEKQNALESAAEGTDEQRTLEQQIDELQAAVKVSTVRSQALAASSHDDKIWAAIVTVLTAIVLMLGRYRFIQSFATFMVASFTLITIVNLIMLQSNATYAVSWNDIAQGLSFRLPEKNEAMNVFPLATALATFGIIGVGASELVTYPYWCLEKGYGRFTGPRDDSAEWEQRARGWLRVMRWDAWCSMLVYTFATIAFYLLGAAILGRIQLHPQGTELIRTLSVMYEPVFGSATQVLFLFGAFAVLYSTFFVANASHARVFPDALRVCGVVRQDQQFYRKLTRVFSGIFPFACLIVYIFIPAPTALVLLSGTMQAIMLPMISFAAIYFRYKHSDARLAPGKLWDAFLWVSALGMLIAGGWLALTKVFPALEKSL